MSAALVSMFANVTAKKNEPVEIHAVFDNIRNGKWREQVEQVRVAFTRGGKEAARPIKKKRLGARDRWRSSNVVDPGTKVENTGQLILARA